MDNDRGMPPNPRLGGSGLQVKCAAGVGGDGGRIGGEWVVYPRSVWVASKTLQNHVDRTFGIIHRDANG